MPLLREPQDEPRSNMQLSPPSWSSSSFTTSPRRPFAITETPSSPASSTASQKFEVKRLLSRPADPCGSRPLTLVSTTPTPEITVKRSNSLGRGFLKRRPSKTQDDASTPKARNMPLDEAIPSVPSFTLTDPAETTPASAYARAYAQRTQMSIGVDIVDQEHRPTRARSKSRPRAPSEPAQGKPRHLFEPACGRIVAIGDSAPLALAGAGPTSSPKPEPSFGRGLSRKVSARFRRRKNSIPGGGIMSDGETDLPPLRTRSRENDSHMIDRKEWEAGRHDWSREKERVGLRGIGFTLAPASGSNTRSPVLSVVQSTSSSPRLLDQDATARARISRKRLSRHLSIEDFRGLARVGQEMGATFEMWESKNPGPKNPESRPETDGSSERRRVDSLSRKERTRRDLAAVQEKERARQRAATVSKLAPKDIPVARTESQPPLFRRDDLHTIYKESSPTPSLKGDSSSRRSTMIRSDSMPSECPRPTGVANDSRKENKIWRLVKKMSTGTLKEKKSYQAEKAPPVPPLPTSRRSSIYDYGEEVRPDLVRFGTREPSSTTGSIHSGPSSLSGHVTVNVSTQPQPSRNRSASGGRPSLSHEWRPSMANDSAPSSSPKSSFGKTQSPRTSMSSYIDLGEEIPPLPLGKHIVSPIELAQQYTPRDREPLAMSNTNNTGVGASPSLPPPKRPRTAQKSRDKAGSNITPLSSPALSNASMKPKPNVLRRPTRLNDDGLSVPTPSPRPVSAAAASSPRSPRSASMGLPSPRPRPQTQAQDQLPPRPRSNSLGTVFTFRELDQSRSKSKLTEQEKVAKFEQLLEASDKAGGTLHARLNDRALLSDSIAFDGASVVSEMI
ncbi:unnamed protein product [Rhizoctonia solani]|uniref:Uncharacterized protein n=1 Tax=Rhizoctonia solani TaxID=456999 RepID=A0A8H3GVX0_9AGAM|nr:unnamed protein product [Rhizoctonia solani]